MARRGWVTAALVVSPVAAVYFLPLGDWLAANPLPGQAWMKDNTFWGATLFLLVMAVIGILGSPRSEPAANDPPDQTFDPGTDGFLKDLRQRVRVRWIDQFLSRSLERVVHARLGFQERRDAITSPLQVLGTSEVATDIAAVFADPRTERSLLVLGAPGAGKTTQLLRLAEHLLNAPGGLVPVVVPLYGSEWKEQEDKLTLGWLRRGLRLVRAERQNRPATPPDESEEARIKRTVDEAVRWLAWEIGRLYRLPARNVERWLCSDRSPLVLLFDGLDEIHDPEARDRCVEVLSLLRSRLKPGMVVCSRTDEYFRSDQRLAFGTAVEIMPLSPDDVDDYLRDAGPDLASLREACRRDPSLAKLLDKPLTLTVAVLTYRNRSVDELLANQLEDLWSVYLEEALPRQRGLTSNTRYDHEKSRHYLRSLAALLESTGHDSFAVDALNLSWLRRDTSLGVFLAYLVTATACGAALTGMAWSAGGRDAAAVCALVWLTYFGAGTLTELGPNRRTGRSRLESAQFVSAHWRFDWPAARAAAARAGALGLLISGLLWGNSAWLSLITDTMPLPLLPSLCAGITAGVLALPGRPSDRVARRGRPVSAARRTLVVRLGAGAAALAVLVALPWLVAGVEGPSRPILLYATVAATTGVWLAGFGTSMYGWWSNRAALRAVVKKDLLPKDLEAFLAHTDDRVITQRKLDGHAFIHRTLQRKLVEELTLV
ncbi:NACHT domain-containing NTPase [Nocardia sp. NRRL S-836]|uniref:NACHT domain-containing protein n=1 Tax=Nocardia sp. NRRL S-836 TaxID=1519492 RepID=UPI0006B06272|nr:NACHT domain-containing protein [Nocardia sp. NRRL S-836]KOV84142.1 hypothetical protein ADL03_18030 [Nocardia sp. NRRL S-836]